MIPLRSTLIALAILTVTGPAVGAESDGQWWDIPYPDRFDASSLVEEQPFLSVDGNRLVSADGSQVVLHGVNIADPDKLDFQGHWNRGLFEEIERWGANVIRIPVHPVAWRKRGSDWYFERLDEATRWANALGLYLIIDWHSIGNLQAELFQHPMYVTSPVETARFWSTIAHRYRSVPTLAVYELFNEPTDNFIGAGAGSLGKASWEDWREAMESLIDLVRVYDDSVIPLVAGFNWAYDLGPVSDQPIRRDGIAYAIHPYPQKARPERNTRKAFFELWQQQWGHLADTYPLMATEMGWVKEDGYGSHIPVINNDGTYGPSIVEFLQDRDISWTAWVFDPDWSPTMISDWNFTPTEQGRFFREVMQADDDGPIPLAILPSPRATEYQWMSIERWQTMHAEDVAVASAGEVDLLFLGDSITEGWPEGIWSEHFGAYRPANFGIGGDKTQNLLWRLQNGSVGQLDPKVVVLMIGVNNFGLGTDTPEQVMRGVERVIRESEVVYPNAHIVLLGILPYGEEAGTDYRRQVTETNTLLSRLDEDPRVSFYDIGAAFLQEDGSISPKIMADFLHPTEAGYVIFANQLDPILADLFE